MATISTQLRKFKEPTKDELTRIFFSLPPEALLSPSLSANGGDSGKGKGLAAADDGDAVAGQMEVNAVLSLGQEGVEDSYVRHQLLFLSCACVCA